MKYRIIGIMAAAAAFSAVQLASADGRNLQAVPAMSGNQDGRHHYTRTLRVDYIFSGTDRTQEIALDELVCLDGWYGRRGNMDRVPLKGNGQIAMRDAETGEVLYMTSFSTLFQEWQATEEAVSVRRSFENVFLLPMPCTRAEITVELYDFKGNVSASMSHTVNPDDILIRHTGRSGAPFRYTHRGGEPEKCIDVAILAEGYTEQEMDVFYRDAEAATESLFSHEPFRSMKDRFNIVAVGLPSEESGVSVPLEGVWKRTALSSHFSTFYSDRYLTTLRLKDLHNSLAGIPYEHIIILANTDVYGGGGIYNSYTLTTAHHPAFRPVVVHEFGHSFAGLADEYYYDDQYVEYYYPGTEPWEQNITTLADFGAKWKDMLDPDTPVPTPQTDENKNATGVYEGAGYQSKGVYRGFQDCRMKTNGALEFCPVCQRAITDLIMFYTE